MLTAFARAHPREVSGLVLIDPASQFLPTVLPAAVWFKWTHDIKENGRANQGVEQPNYPGSIIFSGRQVKIIHGDCSARIGFVTRHRNRAAKQIVGRYDKKALRLYTFATMTAKAPNLT